MSLAVKEIKEVFKGLELLGVAGKKISKDGIGLEDLSHLLEVAKDFDILEEAVKGIKDIPAEFKDLNKVEVMELVGLVFSLIKNIKNA